MFVWTARDPRTFDQANTDALARASVGAWGIDEIGQSSGSRAEDLLALIARSLLIRQALISVGDPAAMKALAQVGGKVSLNVTSDSWKSPPDVDHQNAQYILIRTWEVLARSEGWQEDSSAQLSATSGRTNSFVFATIVIAILALAALVAFVVYNVNTVIDRELARKAQAQELLRAHAECQKMLEDHAAREAAAGHPIPFSLAELAVMKRLALLQDAAMQGFKATLTPTLAGNKSNQADPWPQVVENTLALVVILGFGYLLIRRSI